jgi:endonuclease III
MRSPTTSKPVPSVVRDVVRLLKQEYGISRHGNPHRPLNDLFYILLSNRTTAATARSVYTALRRAFPSWANLTDENEAVLRGLLKPAGLSRIRSQQMLGIASRLRAAFGTVTLAPLRSLDVTECERFLVTLPGVSSKVAKCVMMYAFNHPVLPVDVHVHRLSSRLGWTTRRRADASHEDLALAVPPELRFAYHVCAISHGRSVCRSLNPRCSKCVVRSYCQYYRRNADGAA